MATSVEGYGSCVDVTLPVVAARPLLSCRPDRRAFRDHLAEVAELPSGWCDRIGVDLSTAVQDDLRRGGSLGTPGRRHPQAMPHIRATRQHAGGRLGRERSGPWPSRSRHARHVRLSSPAARSTRELCERPRDCLPRSQSPRTGGSGYRSTIRDGSAHAAEGCPRPPSPPTTSDLTA